MVDETGAMNYHPYKEVFDMMDEVLKIRAEIPYDNPEVRISGNGRHRDINLPLKDAELAWLIKRVGDGTDNLWCRLEKHGANVTPCRSWPGRQ